MPKCSYSYLFRELLFTMVISCVQTPPSATIFEDPPTSSSTSPSMSRMVSAFQSSIKRVRVPYLTALSDTVARLKLLIGCWTGPKKLRIPSDGTVLMSPRYLWLWRSSARTLSMYVHAVTP